MGPDCSYAMQQSHPYLLILLPLPLNGPPSFTWPHTGVTNQKQWWQLVSESTETRWFEPPTVPYCTISTATTPLLLFDPSPPFLLLLFSAMHALSSLPFRLSTSSSISYTINGPIQLCCTVQLLNIAKGLLKTRLWSLCSSSDTLAPISYTKTCLCA